MKKIDQDEEIIERADEEEAHSIALLSCDGDCCIHVGFFDHEDRLFADAALNRSMATELGEKLIELARRLDS